MVYDGIAGPEKDKFPDQEIICSSKTFQQYHYQKVVMVRFFFTAVLFMLVFTFSEALGNVMVKYQFFSHKLQTHVPT